jgi:hypothetical protein
MTISPAEALQRASDELLACGVLKERAFALFAGAALGNPVAVRNTRKEFSYWTVPIQVTDHVVGFVRVLDTGAVAAIGSFCQDPALLRQSPREVTGLSSGEALQRARAQIQLAAGETLGEPLYVHDGPPGREAWLIEVLQGHRAIRWVFVTPTFLYERRAGEALKDLDG